MHPTRNAPVDPAKIAHELRRREFWTAVYLNDQMQGGKQSQHVADTALAEFDHRFQQQIK